MKTILFFLLFFSMTIFAFSPTDLAKHLQQYKEIKGDFQQERYLSGMTQPILSTGKFTLQTNQALLWEMESPFPSRLEVSGEGIKQSFGDNKIPAAGSPSMNQTQIKLLLALIGGDMESLEQYFSLQVSGSLEQWTLTLVPKSLFLQQIFSQIVVTGGQFVDKVELIEQQGDTTILTFQDQSVTI